MGAYDIGPERDDVVARHLRTHLDAGARDDVLLARIRSAVQQRLPETGLDVLAQWLRPGLAAAALLVLGTALWLTLGPVEAGAMAPADEMAIAEMSAEPSAADALFQDAMRTGGR